MSFSVDVRAEIARTACEKRCCAEAELLGAVLACGGVTFRGLNRYGFQLSMDGREAAKRYLLLMKRFFRVEPGLLQEDNNRLGGITRFVVEPPEREIPRLLKALSLLDRDQPFGIRRAPAEGALTDECCRKAFLRGAYLVCGSMDDPQKAYHLEFSPDGGAMADAIQSALGSFDIPARRAIRKERETVYLKEGEMISSLLALLGAHAHMLELENIRIVKGFRNEANRLSNCDSNNVDKAVEAAQRQISMIAAIQKKRGLASLPGPLAEVAELRLRYPDVSLTELGEMLTPTLGKSGVSARMRKLEAIAERIVNGE